MPIGRNKHPKHPFTDLTPEQFAHAIQRGLGRAYLFVRDFDFARRDFAPYRNILLDACLKSNIAQESYGSEQYTAYLICILNCTDHADFYQKEIVRFFVQAEPHLIPTESRHTLNIVKAFASDGDTHARSALYACHDALVKSGDFSAAESLLWLDGEAGLRHVVKSINPAKPGYLSDYQTMLWGLASGEEDLDSLFANLRTRFSHDKEITAFLQSVEHQTLQMRYQNEAHQQTTKRTIPQHYGELKTAILEDLAQGGHGFWYLEKWGAKADESEFLAAAHDFLNETSPAYLSILATAFLWLRRPFPLSPDPLIEKVRHDNHPDAEKAMFRVLEGVTHPAVREFALNLLQDGQVARAAQLLAKNFHPGDWAKFEALPLEQLPCDVFHRLGIELNKLPKTTNEPEMARVMLRFYEWGTCYHCRSDFVYRLQHVDELWRVIRRECLADAFYLVRESVRYAHW